MLFDPESIDRLSPEARVEVQDFYVRKYFASRERRQPDRRGTRSTQPASPPAPPAPRPWPRVWSRNDSSRTLIYR